MSPVDLGHIPALPLDEAFAITADYNADSHPQKVSLGAGVYRDENGKPWVLPSVSKVRKANSLLLGICVLTIETRQSNCFTTLISITSIYQ